MQPVNAAILEVLPVNYDHTWCVVEPYLTACNPSTYNCGHAEA